MQITEVVDDRSQWEMYYPPFQAAVDAGLLSMMCSYNKIQLGDQPEGRFSCENPRTLQRYVFTAASAATWSVCPFPFLSFAI